MFWKGLVRKRFITIKRYFKEVRCDKMNNILYITDIHPYEKRGAGVLGKMHNQIVREIGGESVFTIYITGRDIDNNQSQMKISSSLFHEKVQAVLWGYTPYLCSRIVKTILRVIEEKNIDIVYIDNSISGKLIKCIKKSFPKVKVIVFFHDIQTKKMKEEKGHSILKKCILPTYYSNEKQTVRYADRKIVLNQRDAKLYYEIFGVYPDTIAPICVETFYEEDCNDAHTREQKLILLFVGADYGPNVSGIRWFINEVLSNIQCKYVLNIVGYKMEKYKKEFESANCNVRVIGTVESLEPYYKDADVVIGPIFDGGGMKVKTAEAFMHGKIYIGTTESLEGYWEDVPKEYKNVYIYKSDSAQVFSNYIDKVYAMTFPKRIAEVKKWALSKYTKHAIKELYQKVFDSL